MVKKLSIIGAGGHGKVIADMAFELRLWGQIDFFDDNLEAGSHVDGIRVAGKSEILMNGSPNDDQQLIVGIGDNKLRMDLQNRLSSKGWKFATVVHPLSVISTRASLGAGTVVMAGVVVNTGAKVGTSCILNTRCSVDHDCLIKSGAHLCPGSTLAGNVSVGERGLIGAGATIINGISVGADSILGAGSAAIRSIPMAEVHAGCPARKLRSNVEC